MLNYVKHLVEKSSQGDYDSTNALHKLVTGAGAMHPDGSTGYDRWTLHHDLNINHQSDGLPSFEVVVERGEVKYAGAFPIHISSDGEPYRRSDFLVGRRKRYNYAYPTVVSRPEPMYWKDSFGRHDEQYVIDLASGVVYYYRSSGSAHYTIRIVAREGHTGDIHVWGWIIDPASLGRDGLVWCEDDEELNAQALALIPELSLEQDVDDLVRQTHADTILDRPFDQVWTMVFDSPDKDKLAQDITDLVQAAFDHAASWVEVEKEDEQDVVERPYASPSYDEDDDDDEYLGKTTLAKLREQALEFDKDEDDTEYDGDDFECDCDTEDECDCEW